MVERPNRAGLSSWMVSWLALAVLVLWAAPLAALPRDAERWQRFDSEHFVLISNAGSQQAQQMLTDLESLRRALAEFTRLHLTSPVPAYLYLFDNDRSLLPYKHLYRGEPASMSGAFYSGAHGDYITMNGERVHEATVTVFHEYVHTVLRNNLPGMPLWFEEGLADFFSTLRVRGNEARIGRAVPWHLTSLGSGEVIPLRQLMAADTTSPLYNEYEHQGEFYAQSWSIVHYLLIGSAERRQQAMQFLGEVLRGEDQDAAFRRSFGIDYPAFEAELRRYREAGFTAHRLTLEKAAAEEIRGRPLTRAELFYRLGDLLASQGDRAGGADLHFREALRADPGSGLALAGLGWLAEQEDDWPSARALYRRAAERQPEHHLVHYLYGNSLAALGGATARATLERAQRHLQHSVELEPRFAPAWSRLTDVYNLLERGDGKVERMLPSQPEIALQVLLLYSRTGQQEAARRLWRDYFASHAEAATIERARHILHRMDWLLADGGTDPEDLVR